MNFAKFLRTPILTEHPMAASKEFPKTPQILLGTAI